MNKETIIKSTEVHADHFHFMEALRAGQEQIINEIYQKFTPKIKKWILNNNGTLADAADIFQEAMEVLVFKAHDINFQLTCPLDAFIFKICRNKWMTKLKEKKKENQLAFTNYQLNYADNSVDQLVDQSIKEIKYEKLVERTFSKLGDLCQQVLQLFKEGKKPQEIADTLKMNSANTVYRRKFACLESWKKLIQADQDYIYFKPE